MKEIGGYFELDQLIDKPYHNHKNVVALNTGRNALIYLVKAKKIKKIYLPYFLCNSVTNMLVKYSIEFEYYHINTKFMPLFNKELQSNEYLYVVNYYGQITDEKIEKLKESFRHIIIDNTQAFFQKPILGMDTIYSCRKFFGVPDGAYLYTSSLIDEDLKIDLSKNRMEHILGRYEGQASDYYGYFQKNDSYFKELSLKKMSKLTRNILGAIDYEKVRITRNNNYMHLHEKLKSINVLEIVMPNGAFAYPYYAKDGIEIRKKLAEKKIYIPTLWPNVLKENSENSIEYDYAANILPLPCDQRYGEKDMEKVLNELDYCLKLC